MSLTPLLFSDWWEDLRRPHRPSNQDFGLVISPEDFLLNTRQLQPKSFPPYYQPCYSLRQCPAGGTSTVHADEEKFQVVLDVQQFQPEEIDVKVVENCVVVTAKHEEKRDEHGWVSRQFVRKYMIPEQCDLDQVASKLSTDGLLTITAPRKDRKERVNERVIKIEHTGKPAVQDKPAKKDAEKK